MIETHIEQGPILEDAHKDIGVVDCVLGMIHYRLKFYGATTHAGTFPMKKRKDAFLAASRALCYLHDEIDALQVDDLVYTTGEMVAYPCIHSCVPDYFDFSFDARNYDKDVINRVLAIIKHCEEVEWEGCRCRVEKGWNRDTVFFHSKLVKNIESAAKENKISYQFIHSGAGHDAQFCAYMILTAMIFVQSRAGVSHCEEEYSKVEHCAEGATVMLNAVIKTDVMDDLHEKNTNDCATLQK